MVDPFAVTPLYVQIADIIAGRIERGELRPLHPIPSEKTMTQEYGVGRSTARAAVAELRRRELVFTVPQRGTFVAARTE